MTTSRLTRALLGLCVAAAMPLAVATPSFDSSGNGLLNGNYYFRQVFYILNTSGTGGVSRAISLYGNISFDGNGNYSMANSFAMDLSNGQPVPLSCEVTLLAGGNCASLTASTPVAGTYTLAASGYGYLANPLSSGTLVYMTVGNSGTTTGGLITGSSTEAGFNDVFIAGKIVSPTPSLSTFSGQWTIAGFLPGGTPTGAANLFFQVTPNGAGNLGNVAASGYIGGTGSVIQTQNISNVKYIASNGAAVLQFPNSTSSTAYYFSGNEYLYFSPDNNFVFGGSPTGYDLLVGLRNDATSITEKFSGLYYQSGVDQDLSTYSGSGFAALDTFYGSFSAVNGNIVAAQRVNNLIQDATAYSNTFADSYPNPILGSAAITDTNTQLQYAYGDGGTVRIGAGIWPYLGLSIAFQAPPNPAATGPVYLYPTGITNAASSAPFTAGISNGELLTLYGTGLAASTVLAHVIPFPTTLGGVQVLINGQAAPIYYVSAGQVSVIVPYENPYGIATIQVFNNNVASNVVTEFVTKTSVGLFTVPAGGLGLGALLHNTTGALVTEANPAQPGEYVQAFVTGLGNVFPTVVDGAAGPTAPSFSYSTYFSTTATQSMITAYIGGVSAPVIYAGLAPGLAGLYQINLQIPTGLTAGDNQIDISGPDSYSSQAYIPIGNGTATASSGSSAEAVGRRSIARRRSDSRTDTLHPARMPAFSAGSLAK